MGTVFDYLNWRGDLSFGQAPINEVDSLIFSLVSYLDFSGIISPEHDGTVVPLKAAANSFFSRHPDWKTMSIGAIIPRDILNLFHAIKDTKRFSAVGMKAFVDIIDLQKEMQFSAITFLPEKTGTVVAFRGTDDSIVGWKENFNMSFMPEVPAQAEAVRYLDLAADSSKGPLFVTGHSKGGNLSVYATVHSKEETRRRIVLAWNNDGPGFNDNLFQNPSFLKLRPVIRSIVPQTSMVGTLMSHDDRFQVVRSRQAGFMQHNGLTWEVMGSQFVHLKKVTEECKRYDKTVNQWIFEMSKQQREEFTDAVFSVLSSDNAMTLTDLVSLKNRWVVKGRDLDPKVHQTIQKMLTMLVNVNAKNMLGSILGQKS